MVAVFIIVLAIVDITICLWLGKTYYNYVLEHYNESDDLVQACIFGILFMSICVSILGILLSIADLIVGLLVNII